MRRKPPPKQPGRPIEYPNGRTTTAIRLPPELHHRLQLAAKERQVSMNWLVIRATEEFLDHLIPVEELKWTR